VKISIEEIINRDYSEQSELVVKKEKWMQPDYLDKKYLHFGRPHSEDYFNPAGTPFFLIHFKELSWLNLFPAIFVRDGLVSIAHFFFKFPKPEGINSILLLPKEAEGLIPKSWLSTCLLYELKRFKNTSSSSLETIYITGSINENNYNINEIENDLKNLKKTHSHNFKALLFDNIQLGKEYTPNTNHHNVKFYNMLFRVFGESLEFVNWEESKEASFSETAFFEINQNKLNNSDSFVTFNFLSGGSTPLNEDRYLESTFSKNSLRVSKYHFLEFSHPEESKKSLKLWDEINSLREHVLSGEKQLTRTYKNFEKVHLCTPEFESIISKNFKTNTL